jgi:hypothetical protein
MDKRIFAPVIIPTLCRFNHFKRCIESLVRCTHAKNTDLYIALDYPSKDSHFEGYNKINSYIDKIYDFKNVIIYRRQNNYGAMENYKKTVDEVLKQHDYFILSEDDNEFSVNYLDYINKGLELFKENKEILAICGYNYPIEMPSSYKLNHYYMNEFVAWGYATWKDRYQDIRDSRDDKYIKKALKRNIFKLRKSFILAVYFSLRQNYVTDDTLFTLKLYDEKLFCVFPRKSMIKNWGHDGTGVNSKTVTKKSQLFLNQNIDSDSQFDYDNSLPRGVNKDIRIILDEYYSSGFPAIKQLFSFIYHQIKGI